MRLVSYLKDGHDQLAFYVDGCLYDTNALHPQLPSNMSMFLQHWDESFAIAQPINKSIVEGKIGKDQSIQTTTTHLLAPIPFPTSCRDAYAFRQHVETARKNRKLSMIPEFDQFPVFYFTNHYSIQGPGPVHCMPDHLQQLDFELECAIVICKQGKNIPAAKADHYIGGLMIMNDISARQLQMEEMLLNLGPAKGKDFATVIGPWLVTTDELEPHILPCKQGHTGNTYNLKMNASVNGKQVSTGNLSDMHWTFAEIIERCSYGVNLYPGDIIGSGTVGTGCFLELNGTNTISNSSYQQQWLQAGDVVEMEIEHLGKLTNTIIAEKTNFSILALKK